MSVASGAVATSDKGTIHVGALIDQSPVRGFQLIVAFLCGFIVFLDGFDTQIIAFIAPPVAAEFGLTRAELGPLFVASLVGILFGALFFGPLADRYGRRTVILISTVLLGALTLASAASSNAGELMALRFATGLGLGGAMPNAIALTAEFCPKRRRATMVMIMFTGFSLGAAAAGGLSASLMPLSGWRTVLVVGGALPLALVVLLYAALPESVRFLVLANAAAARIAALLRKLVPQGQFNAEARYVVDEEGARGIPVVQLFRARPPIATVLLWVLFFANLLTNFTLQNWIPTLAADSGIAVGQAVMIGTMYQVGGVIASLLLGLPVDRLGPFRVVPLLIACAVPFIALLGQVGAAPGLLMALTFGAGFCIVGGQNCANALAAIFYPTSVRSTGVGWALGVGRIGAIIGPVAAGWLLSRHWSMSALFLIAAIAPACAALACFVMGAITRKDRLAADAASP